MLIPGIEQFVCWSQGSMSPASELKSALSRSSVYLILASRLTSEAASLARASVIVIGSKAWIRGSRGYPNLPTSRSLPSTLT